MVCVGLIELYFGSCVLGVVFWGLTSKHNCQKNRRAQRPPAYNFYSTVTDFAKFLGLSTSQPFSTAK